MFFAVVINGEVPAVFLTTVKLIIWVLAIRGFKFSLVVFVVLGGCAHADWAAAAPVAPAWLVASWEERGSDRQSLDAHGAGDQQAPRNAQDSAVDPLSVKESVGCSSKANDLGLEESQVVPGEYQSPPALDQAYVEVDHSR